MVRLQIERVAEVASVSDFVASLSRVRRAAGERQLWYRGHCDAGFRLIPSIARPQAFAGRNKSEPPPHASDAHAVKIVRPLHDSSRVLAQDGAFTLHADPWRDLESLVAADFSDTNLDVERLVCWRVPRADKLRITRELAGLGITHHLVYPDLDGIALSLLHAEVLAATEPA